MAYEINAEERTIFGKKVKRLRESGIIPAEIYGRGTENQSVQFDGKTLRRVLNEAGGTHLISITVGNQGPVQALARNVQYSPVRRRLLHVDFYTVRMDQTVTVTIPIHLVGENELVKDTGGTLMSGINSLEIEALPADLPESVEVDISVLENFSDSILVSDLKLPDTITVLSSEDSLVATVQPPRTEEELESLDDDIEALVVEEEDDAEGEEEDTEEDD